jgi:type VI protein secretion system component VasF
MFAELEKLAAAGKKAQAALPSLGKSGLAKLTEAAAAAGAGQDLDALAALAKKQLDSAGMSKELGDLKKLSAALAEAVKPEGGPAKEPEAPLKALPPPGADAGGEAATPFRARRELADIHRKLIQIVRDAAEGLPSSGSFGGIAGELQYALCAIFDEWLLFPAVARSVLVPGEAGGAPRAAAPSPKEQLKSGWEPWLLEDALFGTAHAGRQVFFRMLQLPSRHFDEPVRRELAHMYLAVLELGFQGEWRSATESVEQCRQVLLPLLDEPETASVNLHVLSNEPDRRRAPMKLWWRALLYALLAYVVLAVIVGLVVGFW